MSDGQITLDTAAELAVFAAAPGCQADAAALCDSAAFMDQIKALEPASPGFGGRVATAVRTAAESDPRYRAAAPQGGVAGTAPPRQWTRDDLKGRSHQEVAAAMEAGLLVDLGCPPAGKRRGAA